MTSNESKCGIYKDQATTCYIVTMGAVVDEHYADYQGSKRLKQMIAIESDDLGSRPVSAWNLRPAQSCGLKDIVRRWLDLVCNETLDPSISEFKLVRNCATVASLSNVWIEGNRRWDLRLGGEVVAKVVAPFLELQQIERILEFVPGTMLPDPVPANA